MADFAALIAHLQLLEDNIKYPINTGPSADASEFQSTVFGSINPFDSGGAGMFATRYDSGFGSASTFDADGGMGQAADMDAFLASLAPPKNADQVALHQTAMFPNSPGIPLGCFQDRSPDQPAEIQFDNYAAYGFDAAVPGVLEGVVAQEQFQPGTRLDLKSGTYPGPIVIEKDVLLRADGEVYVQGNGVGIIVQKGAKLVIEGFGFLQGSDFVVMDGNVQIHRCSFASCLQVKGNSTVSCHDCAFQNADNWSAITTDNARLAFYTTTFTGRGLLVSGGDVSMLSCRVENVYESAVRVERGLARFDQCAFQETVNHVIDVEGHSDVIISQSTIGHSQSGHLVNVTRGALVKIKATELVGSCKGAIVAANGCTVAGEDLTVNKPIVVGTAALLRLKRCCALTVYVNSARLSMQDCKVENAPRTAVVGVGTADLQIESSAFIDCSSNAIEVTEQANLTVTRSRFQTSRQAGVVVLSRSATFRHSQFIGNTVGVQLSGNGPVVSFETCSFTDNQSAGVTVLDGSTPKFANCQFKTNDQFAVVVTATSAGFTSCEFAGNKGTAVLAVNAATPSFDSCVFDGNAKFAVQLTGRGTIAGFDKCSFQHNKPASAVIMTSKASATFKECIFQESGLFHLEIRDDDCFARFENCRLSKSDGGVGIFSHDGSKVEIEKCLMKEEGKTSLYAGMQTQSTVTGCEIGNNGQCALMFDAQSRATVKDSKIKYNDNAGIQIEGGDIRIEGCEIEGHYFYGIAGKTGAQITQERNHFDRNEKGDVHMM
jgi:nitrous oxidase accessory protein NosD